MAIDYRCFSKNSFTNWEESGKKEVSDLIKRCLRLQDPCFSKKTSLKDLNHALHEVVWAVVLGDLSVEDGKVLFQESMELHAEVVSQLVEIFALVDIELSCAGEKANSTQSANLVSLMKNLALERMYKERLELDTLEEIDIVKNKKLFHTKQIKVRTKMYYKQQKFNLLREECEGYAKLVTELNQSFDGSINPKTMITVIRSLIGCFNLDPNRVLDLVLESMEARPHEHNFYTALLKLFPCQTTTITELLGFRIKTSQDLSDRKQVLRSMALLVQAGVLTLDEVYVWLNPEDSTMRTEFHNYEEEARELARKANVISTKDKTDKDKNEEKEDEIKECFDENKYKNNTKVHFCVALLEIGDWDNFERISARFPEFYLPSIPLISTAIAELCHITIEPHYRSICSLPTRVGGRPLPPMHNPHAIGRCLTLPHVTTRVLPMVAALGPYIARHPLLFVKILRVARAALQSHKDGSCLDDDFYHDFLSILDESLLPGLSMLHSNPCMAEEVWEVLQLYPYEYRFKLYGRWKNDSMNKHALLVRIKTNLLKKTKYIMMRVTKETVKPVSRTIAKLTHNCPASVLEYIVKQIQLYENLISPIVDSLKYLSSLSMDVLAYCIVEIMTTNKDRVTNAGMTVEPWLTSLSNFTGNVLKKHTMQMCGILQFVANQLKADNSVDLIILGEVLQKMGGTDTIEGLTQDQIEAMTGGEILRREAGQYQQERNTKRSSQRLKESLLDNQLAIPLLLLMAQQRSAIVYDTQDDKHLKLVGKLYDQCQETLVQYGSYLFAVMSLEELSERLPGIGELLSECYINSDIAFFVSRPNINNKINAAFEELRRSNKSGDHTLQYVEACQAINTPLTEEIRPHFPAKLWEEMHPLFFLTFWSLSMSDLDLPRESYKREVSKLNDAMALLQKVDKKDDAAAAGKKKKEVERLLLLKEKMLEEETLQEKHVERVHQRLAKEKECWFTQRVTCLPKNDTVTAFLQLCLFPRCTFTTLDALYCARFVKLMHELKTPNFSTLIFCDRMFCDITYTVASCTEQEAIRYAQFLHGTLEMVMHWHSSAENYERECAKFPGFVTRFRVSKMESNDYVDYENYRHVVHKWHFKMTKALVTCLESKDYIQIRNAILVLQGIHSCFPAIVNLANVIDKRIEKVKKDEKNARNDLYVLANSYSGRLRSKKNRLLQEKDFHQVRKPEEKKANGVKEEDVKKEEQQNGTPKLDSDDLRKDIKRSKPDDVEGENGVKEESESQQKNKRQKTEENSKTLKNASSPSKTAESPRRERKNDRKRDRSEVDEDKAQKKKKEEAAEDKEKKKKKDCNSAREEKTVQASNGDKAQRSADKVEKEKTSSRKGTPTKDRSSSSRRSSPIKKGSMRSPEPMAEKTTKKNSPHRESHSKQEEKTAKSSDGDVASSRSSDGEDKRRRSETPKDGRHKSDGKSDRSLNEKDDNNKSFDGHGSKSHRTNNETKDSNGDKRSADEGSKNGKTKISSKSSKEVPKSRKERSNGGHNESVEESPTAVKRSSSSHKPSSGEDSRRKASRDPHNKSVDEGHNKSVGERGSRETADTKARRSSSSLEAAESSKDKERRSRKDAHSDDPPKKRRDEKRASNK